MARRAAPVGPKVAWLRCLIWLNAILWSCGPGVGSAIAGAWTQPKGQAQVITSFAALRADDGFDLSGGQASLPAAWRETRLDVFAEYGLTDRLTVQLKANWQDGEDAFYDYHGRGPVEIGATWQVWRDDRNAVSLYGGYADAGQGRNADYAPPGLGGQDWEARVAVGRALSHGGRYSLDNSFMEIQAARRFRGGLPDETRMEATLGARFADDWMVLGQAYAGAADGGSRWLTLEASLTRDLGDWSVQGGWRQTVAGQEIPIASGAVFSVWRRF